MKGSLEDFVASQPEFVAEAEGLEGNQAFAVWMRCGARFDSILGVEMVQLAYADDREQQAWLAAFESTIQAIPLMASEAKGGSRKELAKQINRGFQVMLHPGQLVAWEMILPEFRLKWEFFVRAAELILGYIADDGPIEHYEIELAELFRSELALLPKEAVS